MRYGETDTARISADIQERQRAEIEKQNKFLQDRAGKIMPKELFDTLSERGKKDFIRGGGIIG
jgi:Mg/Co/Ni transporter MgtE